MNDATFVLTCSRSLNILQNQMKLVYGIHIQTKRKHTRFECLVDLELSHLGNGRTSTRSQMKSSTIKISVMAMLKSLLDSHHSTTNPILELMIMQRSKCLRSNDLAMIINVKLLMIFLSEQSGCYTLLLGHERHRSLPR